MRATKGGGEAAVLAAFPARDDRAPVDAVRRGRQVRATCSPRLIAALPALPVFGPQAQLQPLFVDDAAAAIADALADPGAHGGKTYELAGPEVVTMLELHRRIAAAQGRERALHRGARCGCRALFAALPGTPMNSDQWTLLKRGNVASGTLPGLKELGVTPRPLGLFLDRWMTRYRKHGRFGDKRAPARLSAGGAVPSSAEQGQRLDQQVAAFAAR